MKESFNVWIGLRSSDYQMFADLIEIDQILSLDIDDTGGVPLISKELLTKRRQPWSNDEMLAVTELEEFTTFCEKIATMQVPVNIYGYHSVPVLEHLAREYKHIHFQSSPNVLRERLDDKLQFMEVLKILDLPEIPSISDTINDLHFNELAEQFGVPFVLKLKVGASGGQTYFVSTYDEFSQLRQVLHDQTVIVAQYVSGPSLNINGFVGRENVYMDQPSFQIIGVPECTSAKFTYCGNDFSCFHKNYQYLINDIKQVTEKFGCYMQDIGYYGMFGVDFIYDLKNKMLYALEINPRMQGSTALLARYQFANHYPRLAELYLSEAKPFQNVEPVNASFVLLHNLSNESQTLKNSFTSGIYDFTFSQGQLKLTYQDDQNVFPRHKNELLIIGCPPNGTVVESGAGIVRLEFASAILSKKGRHLKKVYSRIATEIYNSLWKEKEM